MNRLFLIFTLITKQFSLPVGLLNAVCLVESGHNVNKIHYADGTSNSVGICQLKLSTAAWLGFKGTESQLLEPNVNIFFAGKFLHYQLTRYNGNISKAVAAYNAGSYRLNERGIIKNHRYVNKVLIAWKEEE